MRFLILNLVIFSFLQSPAWAIPAEGHKMMIAAPSPYAVEVGKEVIRLGGNLIDVSVAVGLTLSVTSPYYAALGGGGFALVKMKDKVEVLDFRETAPQATDPKFYLNKKPKASQDGGTAVGVPGFPAGLWELHSKYGKLPWRQLFTLPLRLAQNGFNVSGEWVNKTRSNAERFNKEGKAHFIPEGQILKPGEILKQPALARALRELSRKNVKGFYEGMVAEDLVHSVQQSGGVISLEDMKNYKVRWLKPLTTDYEGHKIYLMPPPSSGGVVIKTALHLIEKLKVKKQKPLSVDELHLLGEILSRAFRGRTLLGDPDFHKNPLEFLFSEKYLAELEKSISIKESKKLKPLSESQIKESANTTHFSVMDSEGNAIALTVTLNGNYGSGVVTERFGIALNNEMDDFTTHPGEANLYGLIQGEGNRVEAGKRPLSSMSPTLVEKNGKIVMSLGSPGGPRIISGVLQVLYRVLTTGWDMDAAIQAPRIHHQFLPPTLFVDENRFSPEVLTALEKKGHKVEESWNSKVYGVRVNDKGFLESAFDARGEGAAGGI